MKVTVEIARGRVLLALALDRAELDGVAPGAQVHIVLDPDRIVALPA